MPTRAPGESVQRRGQAQTRGEMQEAEPTKELEKE